MERNQSISRTRPMATPIRTPATLPIATPSRIAPRVAPTSDQNSPVMMVDGIAMTIPLGRATKSGSWLRTHTSQMTSSTAPATAGATRSRVIKPLPQFQRAAGAVSIRLLYVAIAPDIVR